MVTNPMAIMRRENARLQEENEHLHEELRDLREFVHILNDLALSAKNLSRLTRPYTWPIAQTDTPPCVTRKGFNPGSILDSNVPASLENTYFDIGTGPASPLLVPSVVFHDRPEQGDS